MTNIQIDSYVWGGETEADFDFGVVLEIGDHTALVGWDSGNTTRTPLSMLSPLSRADYVALREGRMSHGDFIA